MSRNRIIALAAVATVVTLLILASVLTFGNLGKTATITLETIPYDAVVSMNGNRVNGNGVLSVAPGEYSFNITRNDFYEEVHKVAVKDGESVELAFTLAPSNDAGRAWLEDNPDEIYRAEGVAGRDINKLAESAIEKYPLMNHLPYIDLNFRMDWGVSKKNPTDATAIAIYIQTSTLAGRKQALATIRYLGYDPADYEIVYVKPK